MKHPRTVLCILALLVVVLSGLTLLDLRSGEEVPTLEVAQRPDDPTPASRPRRDVDRTAELQRIIHQGQ